MKTTVQNRDPHRQKKERPIQESALANKDPNPVPHWGQTKRLMIFMLAALSLMLIVPVVFASVLDRVILFGFPLGFYFTAGGALLGAVIGLFWFNSVQNTIERNANLNGKV